MRSEMSEGVFEITPFRFLDATDRAWLIPKLRERRFAPETIIARQGSAGAEVFLLVSGRVKTLDTSVRPPLHEGLIEPGHYFGERAVLFETPRPLELRAIDEVALCVLGAEDFLELIRRAPNFAATLAHTLRRKHGILVAVDHFLAAVRHGVASNHIDLTQLLPAYLALEPALHPLATSNELDLGALAYAVPRLPDNVARTFCFYLTDDLHLWSPFARSVFEERDARARRRRVYEMTPGKSLVLLRDNLSDLIDFVTLLCVFAVEARKIRMRTQQANAALALCIGSRDDSRLDALPFEADEVEGLTRIWPGEVVARTTEIALHHEDFAIQIRQQELDNHNAAHPEVWIRQIAEATERLLGVGPHGLPDDFEVHIVSSNTHSVHNCLDPWLTRERAAILEFGRTHHAELCALPWPDERDLLVALSRAFLEASPERGPESESGGVVLRENAMTGIAVELFDTSALESAMIDPSLPAPTERKLLVNIDYAFGQQALLMMHQLVALFGPRIHSVNILGKAGGLVGRRGDVLVPTGFVEQLEDTLHKLDNEVDVDAIEARLPGRGVHVGPVLTVLGTMVQNRTMLHYYRHLWGAVGLEMEGAWYYRELVQARLRELLHPDCRFRAVYYVSDLPLDHSANLSASMSAFEGIPPLYAITRELLGEILG